MRFKNAIHLRIALLAIPLVAAASTGCVNSRLASLASQLTGSSTPSTSPSATPSTTQGDYFKISNVTIAAPTGGAATVTPTTTIYVDPSQSKAASGTSAPIISTHCAGSTASGTTNARACVCQYSWTETNSTSGTTVSIKRNVQTNVTNAQQSLVVCPAPEVYNTEISDGTTIKVTVLPGSGSQESFSFSSYNTIKNGVQTAGSFRDAEGHSFDNIMHYSCFEQFKRGTQLQSRMKTVNSTTTPETVKFPIATQFCIQKSGNTASDDCPNLSANLGFSAQAYYYNFYIRSTEAGDANQWNDRYACPVVKESLNNASGSTVAQGSLWPLDTNFALSLGKTADFSVGVDAFVELSNGGGDPVSAKAKACDGSVPSGNAKSDSFVQACLGFAAKPNSDGTCPYLRDSNGQLRFTYRLRRMVALYPPLFGVDGKAPTSSQPLDTIYVLDRPVSPPTGSDPLKPYTMRGPKPCPFSLYDGGGVTGFSNTAYAAYGGNMPIYVSTNNASWNNTNVDGTEFPNFDGPQSCSTAFPLVKSDPSNSDIAVVTLGTLTAKNPALPRRFIRPTHAWAPHYEEDIEFQACAPQASPFKDPPLHFSKDLTTGNVAWCAESYPSQNDHVAALDRLQAAAPMSATNPYIGQVRPFTSHVSKNSASAACVATIPSSIPKPTSGGTIYDFYPAASSAVCSTTLTPVTGVARHPSNAFIDTANTYDAANAQTINPVCAPNTCDRTAGAVGGLSWQSFPLLSRPSEVEQAIAADTTYGCVVTWDNGGTKLGKATPKQGCCGGNVHVWTGYTTSTTGTKQLRNTSAHLEPDVSCLTPQY